MPRQARTLSSTGIYHVMLRGIDRTPIFHDEQDNIKFLGIVSECCAQPGELSNARGQFLSPSEAVTEETVPSYQAALVYNYVLMGNHVHLLLKTGSESLSELMKRIGLRYAMFYKWKYHRTGHLFQDRFRSEAIEDDNYLLAVYRYITLNPVKAGLAQRPGEYPWCGFPPENASIPCAPLPLDLTLEELWQFIYAEMPSIHPFRERVFDDEARHMLLAFSGLHNPSDVAKLPREQLCPLFYQLQEEGVSIQQLARLTGIPKSTLARWLA